MKNPSYILIPVVFMFYTVCINCKCICISFYFFLLFYTLLKIHFSWFLILNLNKKYLLDNICKITLFFFHVDQWCTNFSLDVFCFYSHVFLFFQFLDSILYMWYLHYIAVCISLQLVISMYNASSFDFHFLFFILIYNFFFKYFFF